MLCANSVQLAVTLAAVAGGVARLGGGCDISVAVTATAAAGRAALRGVAAGAPGDANHWSTYRAV